MDDSGPGSLIRFRGEGEWTLVSLTRTYCQRHNWTSGRSSQGVKNYEMFDLIMIIPKAGQEANDNRFCRQKRFLIINWQKGKSNIFCYAFYEDAIKIKCIIWRQYTREDCPKLGIPKGYSVFTGWKVFTRCIQMYCILFHRFLLDSLHLGFRIEFHRIIEGVLTCLTMIVMKM